jgi:hypothetical protein
MSADKKLGSNSDSETQIFLPPMTNIAFFDVNVWFTKETMTEIEKILSTMKVFLNQELLVNQFIDKSDEEIFDWLLLSHPTKRIWLFTRDKKMFRHVPTEHEHKVVLFHQIIKSQNYQTLQYRPLIIVVIEYLQGVFTHKMPKEKIFYNKKTLVTLIAEIHNELIKPLLSVA